MAQSSGKQVQASRRERPAKAALTRQGIVDAAVSIMQAEGLGKVTMRSVAAALDTGPASLYVYVRDVEDLHAQILDAQLGSVVTARPPKGTWQNQLKTLLTSYQQVLLSHAGIARMALSTQPNGPNYLALVDRVLALLDEGGVSRKAAAWGVDVLLLLPTASAVEHAPKTPARPSHDFAALAARIAAVDPLVHPHIAALSEDLLSGDGEARTNWALDVLIAGIVALGGHEAQQE
jgi:AcrR family transcriptional regulator